MDMQFAHNIFHRRPVLKSNAPAVKWFKRLVPQDLVSTGGKCMVLKWVNENTLMALKEKEREPEAPEPESEPTTEVLFLCSYGGCKKSFVDAGALKKHSHVHGEKQHICNYEGCGKRFLDRSKLRRHYLIHTRRRDFICPHEGCGKAFSLDFNLRSHMKTHSPENYHICPYPDCGRRYAREYKLKNHITSHHEKNMTPDLPKYSAPSEMIISKTPMATASGSASSDRPYACPYEGCEKAYIHEYKLKLHLRRQYPGHMSDENAGNATTNADNEMDGASDQDAYAGKRGNSKSQKPQSRAKPYVPSAKIARLKSWSPSPCLLAKNNGQLKNYTRKRIVKSVRM